MMINSSDDAEADGDISHSSVEDDAKTAKLREFLHSSARRGNWGAVIEKYKEEGSRAQTIGLTPTKDTALHMAVLDQEEQVVEELLKFIREHDNQRALMMTNESGNTPLHIAASLGSTRMCRALTTDENIHTYLVDIRNQNGETPLFLAARYGHKHVFYSLLYYCEAALTQLRTSSNLRRNDGDTLLHCALRNQQLDLAFHIIEINNEAVHWVDGQGLTALHVLASSPTSFKSGCYLEGWRKSMVYYCTSVEQLKLPKSLESLIGQSWTQLKPKAADSSCPKNYRTCTQFFTFLWHGCSIVGYLEEEVQKKDEDVENSDGDHASKPWSRIFSEKYSTCLEFLKTFVTIVGSFGFSEMKKMREEKKKHSWSVQVMKKLLEFYTPDKYLDDGNTPLDSALAWDVHETLPCMIKEAGVICFNTEVLYTHRSISDVPGGHELEQLIPLPPPPESAMLVAVKNGVIEMVRQLYEHFPLAIRDTNRKKLNALHLAAKFRQPEVLRFLVNRRFCMKNIFGAVDNDGNNVLHHAAQVPPPRLRIWRITGTALQMQWEVKWYQFVKESVPEASSARTNNRGHTPDMIFTDTHRELVHEEEKWLSSTSKSCSVVAALIATVAFASAATIPGGNGHNGYAVLEEKQVFFLYSISSLIALSLSSASVIVFLAILTARFESHDFGSKLRWKLLIGLSSLYFSIIAMLIAFCAAHFFLLSHRLHNLAVFLYVIVFLPVAIIFPISQLPLYFDLLLDIIIKVPIRREGVVLSWEDESPIHPIQFLPPKHLPTNNPLYLPYRSRDDD